VGPSIDPTFLGLVSEGEGTSKLEGNERYQRAGIASLRLWITEGDALQRMNDGPNLKKY
jgi:hypothetical protein